MKLVRSLISTLALALAGCPSEKPAEPPDMGVLEPPPKVEPPPKTEMKEEALPSGPFVDVLAVASDFYEPVQENEWVRVLRATFKPGERGKPHSHPTSIVYALTPIAGNEHTANGKVKAVNHPAGTAFVRDAVRELAFENTSKETVQFLVYEIERGVAPPEPMADAAPDPVSVSPENYEVLAETDQARLMRMSMKPGQKDKDHSLKEHVTYTLTNIKGRFHVGRMMNVTLKKDVSHTQEAIPSLSFENIGKKPAAVLIFERK